MLSCKDATDKLSAQIDGELGLGERVSLRLHQFLCSDCRRFASQMKLLVVSMKDRPPAESAQPSESVDEAYADRILQALDDHAPGE